MLELFKNNVFGLPEVSEEDIQTINKQFDKYVEDNKNIDIYHEKLEKAKSTVTNCKEVVELMIITIINKYEKQSKII